MNTQFKVKLLSHLNKKNQNKGFTLIELLVVVIIVGVLAAIALPNLLNQVARGRQAEARNNLGAINRAQQAFRLERAEFGLLTELPIALGVREGDDFRAQYYVFGGGAEDPVFAVHTAEARDGTNPVGSTDYTNDIRDYASAVTQDTDGNYAQIICEGNDPTTDVTAPIEPATAEDLACDATTSTQVE